jgi:hypothetical protein
MVVPRLYDAGLVLQLSHLRVNSEVFFN